MQNVNLNVNSNGPVGKNSNLRNSETNFIASKSPRYNNQSQIRRG